MEADPWRFPLGVVNHPRMTYFPWSLALIGLAALAAGMVGAALPSGRRLDTLLALLAGAGAGVVVLAVGLMAGLDGASAPAMERLFFTGSFVGTVAVAAVLIALWRRTAAGR
jgi:hypothetical protein